MAKNLNKTLAALEARGVVSARALTIKLRQACFKAYKSGDGLPDLSLIVLDELQPLLQDGMLAAHLIAMQEVWYKAGRAPAPISFSFDEVLKVLEKQLDYDSRALNNQYDSQAFTILDQASSRIDKQLRNTVNELIATGANRRDAQQALAAKFDSLGISPANSYQLENIFRTNFQIAHNAGEWNAYQQPVIDEILWGYQYTTVGDDRVRGEHAELEGVTLPKDDPFWLEFWPPNGWGCRCKAIAKFSPPTTTVSAPEDVRPDPGFEVNFGEVFGDSSVAPSPGVDTVESKKDDIIDFIINNPEASNKEIAERFDTTPGSVASTRSRAKKAGLLGRDGPRPITPPKPTKVTPPKTARPIRIPLSIYEKLSIEPSPFYDRISVAEDFQKLLNENQEAAAKIRAQLVNIPEHEIRKRLAGKTAQRFDLKVLASHFKVSVKDEINVSDTLFDAAGVDIPTKKLIRDNVKVTEDFQKLYNSLTGTDLRTKGQRATIRQIASYYGFRVLRDQKPTPTPTPTPTPPPPPPTTGKTKNDQIIDYVRNHPGAKNARIAELFGTTAKSVASVKSRARKKGLLFAGAQPVIPGKQKEDAVKDFTNQAQKEFDKLRKAIPAKFTARGKAIAEAKRTSLINERDQHKVCIDQKASHIQRAHDNATVASIARYRVRTAELKEETEKKRIEWLESIKNLTDQEEKERLFARYNDLMQNDKEISKLDWYAAKRAAIEKLNKENPGRNLTVKNIFPDISGKAPSPSSLREGLIKFFGNKGKEPQVGKPSKERPEDFKKEYIQEGVKFVNSLVNKSVPKTKIEVQSHDGRSYAISARSKTFCKPSRGAAVVVHELAHCIEYNNKGVKDAVRGFLYHRYHTSSKDQKRIEHMGQYYARDERGLREIGFEDGFSKVWEPVGEDNASAKYVTKYYQHGSTEILSMGLEQMYRNPHKLARKDPEFFDFLINVVQGKFNDVGDPDRQVQTPFGFE